MSASNGDFVVRFRQQKLDYSVFTPTIGTQFRTQLAVLPSAGRTGHFRPGIITHGNANA
jgi:hypothetical protein